MNATEYLELSQATSADDRDGVSNLSKLDRTLFDRVFMGFAAASSAAEKLKKQVYYGRDLPRTQPIVPADLNCPFTPTTLHANLGIMGEAGELVDATTRDEVLAEGGDLLWYIAKRFREQGITFEEAFDYNINKLRARYPDKFTTQAANAPREGVGG